jgi:hypothetical protein
MLAAACGGSSAGSEFNHRPGQHGNRPGRSKFDEGLVTRNNDGRRGIARYDFPAQAAASSAMAARSNQDSGDACGQSLNPGSKIVNILLVIDSPGA